MYYKKHKSIIRSIKNNKNNKVYYALIIVMLAAIGIIAACIMLNSLADIRFPPPSQEPSSGSAAGKFTDQTSVGQTEDASGDLENPVKDQPPDGAAATNPAGDVCSDYAVYLFPNEKLLAVCRIDEQGGYSELLALTQCAVGEEVSRLLRSGEDMVCLSNKNSSASKSLWKNYEYDGETYYVQYYSQFGGIEFHSALYRENGNALSILSETYEIIGAAAGDHNTNIPQKDIPVPSGITLTVKGAKWLYENVPGSTDIYICRNIDERTPEAVKALWSSSALSDSLLEADYMANNMLLTIPPGFHGEPTDEQGNKNYCPYQLGELKNAADKTFEMGQIAYSFVEENSSIPKILFGDVSLSAADGADISQYLMIEADFTGYTPEQLAALNYNNFLVPGSYPVHLTAADIYGNVLEQTVRLYVADTTPPVISLAVEVTEMNRAQTETPEYIIGLVTVTDLCQLSPEGITYTLEEREVPEGENEGDSNERQRKVFIHYSVDDIYGNTGTLDIELQRVGD